MKVYSEKNCGWLKSSSKLLAKYQIKKVENHLYLINRLGEIHQVSSKGSLALLALGSVGVKAWKEAKKLEH